LRKTGAGFTAIFDDLRHRMIRGHGRRGSQEERLSIHKETRYASTDREPEEQPTDLFRRRKTRNKISASATAATMAAATGMTGKPLEESRMARSEMGTAKKYISDNKNSKPKWAAYRRLQRRKRCCLAAALESNTGILKQARKQKSSQRILTLLNGRFIVQTDVLAHTATLGHGAAAAGAVAHATDPAAPL
jgi:hypothetical protein